MNQEGRNEQRVGNGNLNGQKIHSISQPQEC